jgi:hypothetical protein
VGRAAVALLAVVALLGITGCGGDDTEGEAAAGSGELQDVSSVAVVKDAFDADAGTPRLVLLLSPT